MQSIPNIPAAVKFIRLKADGKESLSIAALRQGTIRRHKTWSAVR